MLDRVTVGLIRSNLRPCIYSDNTEHKLTMLQLGIQKLICCDEVETLEDCSVHIWMSLTWLTVRAICGLFQMHSQGVVVHF